MQSATYLLNHRKLILSIAFAAANVGASLTAVHMNSASLEKRVEAIEATKPEMTAAQTRRNAEDNATIGEKIEWIREDVSYLRGHIGLPQR